MRRRSFVRARLDKPGVSACLRLEDFLRISQSSDIVADVQALFYHGCMPSHGSVLLRCRQPLFIAHLGKFVGESIPKFGTAAAEMYRKFHGEGRKRTFRGKHLGYEEEADQSPIIFIERRHDMHSWLQSIFRIRVRYRGSSLHSGKLYQCINLAHPPALTHPLP